MADNAEQERKECILCNEDIEKSDKIRISTKAIESLINASKEIGDKKYLKMQHLSFLNVHRNCSISYVRGSHIATAKKAVSQRLSQTRRENKEARTFDFSSLCFFCATDAITDTHKRPIRLVTSDNVKENILEALKSRPDDEMNRNLRLRLQLCTDLEKKQARYHAKCMQSFYTVKSSNPTGRPMDSNMAAVIEYIIQQLRENSEDSQFSLNELLQNFREKTVVHLPSIKGIKENLKNYFGEDLVMHSGFKDTILCFVDRRGKQLDPEWYSNKAPTIEDERIRIVEMAAQIIYEDIRVTRYSTQNYNAPSSFLDDVEKDIPKSLKVFLDTLIKKNKRSECEVQKKWSKRVATIGHILISCVRPRTFLSSILLGLSSFIHKKFAAKGLLDTLSYLGLFASYHETQLFESSIINDPEQYNISEDAFVQFSFDNADHNTNTIDMQ